jgi:hypothetical protein
MDIFPLLHVNATSNQLRLVDMLSEGGSHKSSSSLSALYADSYRSPREDMVPYPKLARSLTPRITATCNCLSPVWSNHPRL